MKTIEMELAIMRYLDFRKNIIVPNVSWGFGIHECDILSISKSGYATEVEIKVSKSDLKKDKDKRHKHYDVRERIKYLYFALPKELENCLEYVPERAGVIIVHKKENGYLQCEKIRDAQLNKDCRKLDDAEILMITRLGTIRLYGLKTKILKLQNKLKGEKS
jgi:hypothetical protein